MDAQARGSYTGQVLLNSSVRKRQAFSDILLRDILKGIRQTDLTFVVMMHQQSE